MALPSENVSMALYCDFENVALGVRDSKYNKIDIKPVLERLLLKGSIVVKKAYCDWERYKEFKAQMHEASFELIEIPHVRQSGKNSADIRLVVDALDLCYTKSHVNTFVIISGDSDFSPLVSKLRENAKFVIGVGVKDSTSDLLIANCDEFIFIDDLLRENRRAAAKRTVRQAVPATRPSIEEEQSRKEDLEARKSTAIDIALETFDALLVERGDTGKIWASALKQAIKRRKPDFSETYFGFKTFSNLLEEAQSRGLIEIGRDERSGAYVSRSGATRQENGSAMPVVPQNSMRREQAVATESVAIAEESTQLKPVEPPEAATESANANRNVESARRGSGRKSAARKRSTPAVQDAGAAEAGVAELPIKPEENATGAVAKKAAPKRKTAARNSRRTSNNETPAQDVASPPEKNGGD